MLHTQYETKMTKSTPLESVEKNNQFFLEMTLFKSVILESIQIKRGMVDRFSPISHFATTFQNVRNLPDQSKCSVKNIYYL